MDIYVTEEQQLETLKKWLKKYGKSLSVALVTAALIIGGISYWRHHQNVLKEQASENYMALMISAEQDDEMTVNTKGEALLKEFSSSPYATLAGLSLAFEALEKKDIPQAKQHLTWILAHSKQPAFQAIARIRLMRLLISENNLDDALKLYDEKKAEGFLTLMAELKGDILLLQKDETGARAAYEKAFSVAPEEGMHGPLLTMKMEELGLQIKLPEQDKSITPEKEAKT